MRLHALPKSLLLLILLPSTIAKNPKDPQQPLDPDAPRARTAANWATRHMIEEHHLNGWDAETLFTLHDFGTRGSWDAHDVQRLYGMMDETNNKVPEAEKEAAAMRIIRMYDHNKDGVVSKEEFVDAWQRGVFLPDLGFGPGHHGDDEYEYEIHHFEKYHGGDDVKVEDLTHPEDIAHFKMHEQKEREEEEQKRREEGEQKRREEGEQKRREEETQQQRSMEVDEAGIVVANIPRKFLRHA